MILLDTDVLSLIQRDDSKHGFAVRARIAAIPADELVATTIITFQEQTSGWLAYLAKARTKQQQVYAYGLLAKHLDDYRQARVVPYDHVAADIFDELRRNYPRMGTMDLRIAAIALAREATLVTRNLTDFSKIADLQAEDWTRS
jgi:tRNA(fMet)-specific endonuclease VapC